MRILLAGRFASPPHQGGATWAVLQYALGLRGLGHEVLTVDPGGGDPGVDAYFTHVVGSTCLRGQAVLLRGQRTALGMEYEHVAGWARRSDLLINLAGCLADEELLTGPGRRMYVDIDPAFTQLWQSVAGVDMRLSQHDVFATVGQRIGTDRCDVPTCGVKWEHTLPPVVLWAWPAATTPPTLGVTTVANWRSYGSIDHNGVRYGQKAHSMREIIDLPRRVPEATFEPAVCIDPAETADLSALDDGGWMRADPAEASDHHRFRSFVRASAVEIGVAKSGYVMSRCGWFSDRSAVYLASGRPVLAQDTGWTETLPAGRGLLSFNDADTAATGVRQVMADYARHSRAARGIACDLFDSRKVLRRLLEKAGA